MPAPANLVHQTSASTGTGNFTLAAVNGKQSFATAFSTGGTDVFDYYISNRDAAEWERGTGHMSDSTTLVRDTVIESTNANAAVNFSAGTKDVVNDVPAANQFRSDGTALTAVDTADKLPITDVSASNASKTATVAELFKSVNTLTADTAPDPAADYLLTYDASGTAAKKALFTAFARERLSADRTYYVRTDGSDSNTGLANTSGGAFLTIQKAIDVASAVDASTYSITIQVADGTYTENLTLKTFIGSGRVIINGNSTTPSNVVLAGGSSTAISATNVFGQWDLKYFKITGTSVSIAPTNMALFFTGLVFAGTGSAHFYCNTDAIVTCEGNYEISGAATRHVWLASKAFFQCVSKTVTVTGTPAFGTFFVAAAVSSALVNGNTYSGSATGARYSATLNAVINTGGGGASYFPGNSAGSTATGGQYA